MRVRPLLLALALAGGPLAAPAAAEVTVAVPRLTVVPHTTTDVSTRHPLWWSMPSGTTAASYDVQYGVKRHLETGWEAVPTFKDWKVATTATSASLDGAQGTTYWFRVRARDADGNLSAWSAAQPGSVPIDDRSTSRMLFSPGWKQVYGSSRWLAGYTTTREAGRSVTLIADTSVFTVIGDLCENCGQVKAYVDGVLRATYDTHLIDGTVTRHPQWTIALPGGIQRHKLKLVTVGTPGRPRVSIDAIALKR